MLNCVLQTVEMDEEGEAVRICMDGKQVENHFLCQFLRDLVEERVTATYVYTEVLRRPGSYYSRVICSLAFMTSADTL